MLAAYIQNPTIESVANHLENHTATWLILTAAVGPIVAIGLAVFAVVKWFIPLYKEESAASRQHLAEVLTATRKDASEDLKATRDTSREQHAALTAQIGDKLTETHRTVGDIHRIVTSLAVRAGAVTVLLWTLSFSVGASFGLAWQTVRDRRNVGVVAEPIKAKSKLVPVLSHDCTGIGGCESPQYCCGKDACCRNAETEDNYAVVPHSLQHNSRDYGDDVAIGRWRG